MAEGSFWRWMIQRPLFSLSAHARGLSVTPKIAVLIDGDNVSAKIVPQLFNQIARLGEPVVRRVYLNVASGANWSGAMSVRSLAPIHVTSVAQGKNAVDIALTVDAMDILHTKCLDAIAIVSSDADFTHLAVRIREQGLAVHGYGASQTPAPFQRACTSFTFLENLVLKGAGGAVGSAKWTLVPSDAEALLVLAVLRLGGAVGDVDLSTLGNHLRQYEPQFDPKIFRCRTLVQLIGQLDSFELNATAVPLTVRLRTGGARNQATSVPR